MTRRFLLSCLVPFLLAPAWGQQVFIKNQPFSGAVYRDGNGLWVELAPLEWTLGFEAKLESEGARVGEKLVRTIKQGDKVYVSLSQVASALGAVVKENPEFQTVDVHMAVRPKVGAGLDIKPSDLKGEGTDRPGREVLVQGQPVSTAGYAFTLPDGMKLTRDPRLIKTELVGKEGEKAWDNDLKVDALAGFEGDAKRVLGQVVFSWLSLKVPKENSGEGELLEVSAQLVMEFLQDFGCRPVGPPKVLETKGQKLVLGTGVTMSSPPSATMVLVRIDPKRNRTYLVIARGLTDPDSAHSEKIISMLSTITTR